MNLDTPRKASVVVVISLTMTYLILLGLRYYSAYPHGFDAARLGKILFYFSIHPNLVIRYGFYSLWLFHWFYFWFKLKAHNSQSASAPHQILAATFVLPIVFGILWVVSHANHEVHVVIFHPLTQKILRSTLHYGTTITFPLLIIGNLFLWIFSMMGWEPHDPIHGELKRSIKWPRKVNHIKFMEQAFRKNLTYLGFQAEKRNPIYLTERIETLISM